MAEASFGKGKPKVKKTQLKDTIRRMPVKEPKPKGRPKGSKNKKTLEREAAAIVAA
jgi:hypothetical protein